MAVWRRSSVSLRGSELRRYGDVQVICKPFFLRTGIQLSVHCSAVQGKETLSSKSGALEVLCRYHALCNDLVIKEEIENIS